jgi:hypothetical protein
VAQKCYEYLKLIFTILIFTCKLHKIDSRPIVNKFKVMRPLSRVNWITNVSKAWQQPCHAWRLALIFLESFSADVQLCSIHCSKTSKKLLNKVRPEFVSLHICIIRLKLKHPCYSLTQSLSAQFSAINSSSILRYIGMYSDLISRRH